MTKLKTFKIGGIHPDKHKITTESPIADAGLPETVYIPVKQHIGSPAKILVQKAIKSKSELSWLMPMVLFHPMCILPSPAKL